jgi:hypothetical protein
VEEGLGPGMKKRRLAWTRYVGLVLLSGSIFVLTMEICARVDDRIKYDAPLLGTYTSARLSRRDAEGINHNIPGNHFEKWRINSLGFRGEEISLAKPEGAKRVVCMGTSETFGLYESPEKEWPSQLAKMMEGNDPFEIVNAAVVGLGLWKYVPYLRKYVLPLDPNIVILYANPFAYGVGADAFDRRQAAGGNGTDGKEKKRKISLGIFLSYWRIIPKIKESVRGLLPHEVLRSYRLYSVKKRIAEIESVRLNGKEVLDQAPEESMVRFKQDLKRVVRFLQERDIEVVLTTYPVLLCEDNMEDYSEMFLNHRVFYIELSLAGILDVSRKADEVIEEVASESGTGFIDMGRIVPKNAEYFADNVHYTDRGAELVASKFARCLRDSMD